MTASQRRQRWSGRTNTIAPRHDSKQFLSRGTILTVKPTTAKGYFDRIRKYLLFLVRTGMPYSMESFTEFLSAIFRQGAAGPTLNGYRSALIFFQRATLTQEWGTDPQLARACKGFQYHHRQNNIQRGAITVGMLHELMSLDPIYALPFAVLFFGILRIGQLKGICSGDLSVTPPSASLWIRVDKRVKASSNLHQQGHWKDVINQELIDYLEPLQAKLPHGTPLFRWVSDDRLLELVDVAAKRFRWPTNVLFDGVHCLRHGGATFIKNKAGPIHLRSAGMCQATFSHYSRSNQLRSRQQNRSL